MLPQYYKTAEGQYRPLSAVVDTDGTPGWTSFLTTNQRKLLKKVQLHVRSFAQSRGSLVKLMFVLAGVALIGLVLTWSFVPITNGGEVGQLDTDILQQQQQSLQEQESNMINNINSVDSDGDGHLAPENKRRPPPRGRAAEKDDDPAAKQAPNLGKRGLFGDKKVGRAPSIFTPSGDAIESENETEEEVTTTKGKDGRATRTAKPGGGRSPRDMLPTRNPPLEGSVDPKSKRKSPVSLTEARDRWARRGPILDGLPAVDEQQAVQQVPVESEKVTADAPAPVDEINKSRQESIRRAMQHAWSGYEKHAFGHDEVRPDTNRTNDSWNGWGVTLVDALDTLILMGLNAEYRRALQHVETIDFTADVDKKISVFETTIRYLGGLLGAFTLSPDPILLQKAEELAVLLLPAFKTPTGIPLNELKIATGVASAAAWTKHASVLAEAGSVQLEFKYLSQLVDKPIYADTVQKAMDVLDNASKSKPGLYPVFIDPNTGAFTQDKVSVGALADSFYEYLLKQYILSGKKDDQFKRMYIESLEAIEANLIGEIQGRWYIGELNGNSLRARMDHLVCFVPGMIALGAQHLDRPDDLVLAKRLMETCRYLYNSSPSGIAPEIVVFNSDGSESVESAKYFLRPETIESLFVLYRVTGDPVYQEWGWEIFEAIEMHCKTPTAYSGLTDVTKVPPPHSDSMQSFFLAETLKYLYLLFGPTDVIPLDAYVFNTEAHPFRS